MIAHILNNLPADNEHLCASLRPYVGSSLTIAQVRTQVREFYKDLTKRATAVPASEGDTALMDHQCNGRCNNCGLFAPAIAMLASPQLLQLKTPPLQSLNLPPRRRLKTNGTTTLKS